MAEWLTFAEAIASRVHGGDSIAMEGFTHLIPIAAGREKLKARTTETHFAQGDEE